MGHEWSRFLHEGGGTFPNLVACVSGHWVRRSERRQADSTYLVGVPCVGSSLPWRYWCWSARVWGRWRRRQETGAGRSRRWRRRGRWLPVDGHVTTISDHNSAATKNKQVKLISDGGQVSWRWRQYVPLLNVGTQQKYYKPHFRQNIGS